MKLREFLNQLPFGGQQEFAKRVGVSKSYLSQIANGVVPIPTGRVLLMAQQSGYKVTPHELLPEIYPHPEDGLPAELRAQRAAA